MTTDKKLNITLLAARIILALAVLGHGVQKLFGWFGGYGFDATVGFFTDTIGLPYIFAVLIILTETIGMIALILGLFGRWLSISVILIMLGAIFTVHGSVGFFMNWDGTLQGEGYEFHLLAIGLALPIAIHGAGAYSLDQYILNRLAKVNKSKNALPV